MPGEELTLGLGASEIRPRQWRTMQGEKEIVKLAAAVQPRGDEDLQLLRDRDRPTIESLMMDAAAGEPVVGRIRPPELTPANVRCFKPQIRVVEPDCVPAERASMSPGRQYGISEFGIAAGASGCGVQFQTDGIEDAGMQGLREVSRENLTSQFPHCFGAAS